MDWLDCGVRRIYGELGLTRDGSCAYDIVTIIEDAGKKQVRISTRDIKAKFRYKHKAHDIMAVLKDLQGDNEIWSDSRGGMGTYPCWRRGKKP